MKSAKRTNPSQKAFDEMGKHIIKIMCDIEEIQKQIKDNNVRLERLEKLFQWDLTKLNKPK